MSKDYYSWAVKSHKKIAKKNLRQKDEFESNPDLQKSHKDWLKNNGYMSAGKYIEQSEHLWPASLPPYPSYVILQYCKQYGIDFKEMFKLNSSGLRSDEFTEVHDGKHILFAGCSITFGDGMPLDYIWPKIVYNEIAKTEKVSGYFNVGRPGASNIWIIMQIFKYIELYGMPDVIFINLPDSDREIADEHTEHRIQVLPAVMYRFLNKIVSDAGSRIISFSWDARANIGYDGELHMDSSDPRAWLKNFYQYNIHERYEYTFSFCEEHKNSEDIFLSDFAMRAMDDSHPGAAEHKFFAQLALDAFYDRISPSSPTTDLYEMYTLRSNSDKKN